MRTIAFLLLSACSSFCASEQEEEVALVEPSEDTDSGTFEMEVIEDANGGGIRVVELHISPEEPTATDVELRVHVQICRTEGGGSRQCIGQYTGERGLQWVKNGAPLRGYTGRTLNAQMFRKGDEIGVILELPHRDGMRMRQIRSNTVEIGNTPPDIEREDNQDIFRSDIRALFTSGREYSIRASDLDNDELEFSLSGEPEGLTIERTARQSAELHYDTEAEREAGEYEIIVIVDDGDHNARWPFTITLEDNGVDVEEEEEEDEDGLEDEDEEDAAERIAEEEEPTEGLIGADEPDEEWENDHIEGLQDDEPDEEWENDYIEGLQDDED